MVFLRPSSRPASYVRSLLEGTRVNETDVSFFSWHCVGSGIHSDSGIRYLSY